MEPYHFREGKSPLLVSIPHLGTYVPEGLLRNLTPAARLLADTDWHLDLLYTFLDEFGASCLMATHSRCVIDLNRPPDDSSLYPGRPGNGLCPLTTVKSEAIYVPGANPTPKEIVQRRDRYWWPYHDKLAHEIARIRARHGYALLCEAHSIPSRVPRLFAGRLPDINIGTANGDSCGAGIGERLLAVAQQAEGFSAVLNGRFVGGYITRHYGRPSDHVHAVQLELARCTYMDEDTPPFQFRESLAKRVRPHIRAIVASFADVGQPICHHRVAN